MTETTDTNHTQHTSTHPLIRPRRIVLSSSYHHPIVILSSSYRRPIVTQTSPYRHPIVTQSSLSHLTSRYKRPACLHAWTHHSPASSVFPLSHPFLAPFSPCCRPVPSRPVPVLSSWCPTVCTVKYSIRARALPAPAPEPSAPSRGEGGQGRCEVS